MRINILILLVLWGLDFYAQPGGEDCSSATPISSIPFTGIGNTAGALDYHFASCADVSNAGGAPEHVYSYTTGGSIEHVNASLCEAITDFDSQLYIFENNCLSAPVWCQEDGCESPAFFAAYNSRIDAIVLQPSTTYYFVVDGYNSSAFGNYQFNLTANAAMNAPDSSLIPLISINTFGTTIPDEPKITAHMGIINNGAGNYNYSSDPFNEYNGEIGIELRGSSSTMFPKKGYGLETRDGSGANNNVPLFGMPSENDWVLHGPYSDKSLLRNFLAYHLGGKLYNYSPRTQFCELTINDEYKGLYLFQEKIKRDKGRVDIAKLDFDDLAGDSLTGGYILKIDKPTGINNDSWTSPYQSISMNPDDIDILYHYPEPDDILAQQKSYIESYVTAFEDALQGPGYLDSATGYSRYIDVNSFVDYYLLTEATRNVDGYRISTFMYKDKDSKNGDLFIGPPWDYNIGFGNANYCDGELTSGWAVDFNTICSADNWQVPFWWDRLLTDPDFVDRLKCRWTELRAGAFHTDSIVDVIDSVSNLISASAGRNFDRWDILSSHVWPNSYVGNTYPNELDYLKSWIQDRFTWIDNNLPGAAMNCSQLLSTGANPSDWNFKVFPNPSSGRFYIELSGINQPSVFQIAVTDVLGNQVRSKKYTVNRQLTISSTDISELDNLLSGIYLVSIHSGTGIQTLKLIKY